MRDTLKMHQIVCELYRSCGIRSFPIDCFRILDSCRIGYRPYSSQKNPRGCFSVSNDAFTVKRTVFYNDTMPAARISFSLMHELAHTLLDIPDGSDELEDEADYFASCILAPRILIHFLLDRRDAGSIHDFFGLSCAASSCAMTDYRRWLRNFPSSSSREIELELYRFVSRDLKPPTSPFPKRASESGVRSERGEGLSREMRFCERKRDFLLKHMYHYNDFTMAEASRARFEERSL